MTPTPPRARGPVTGPVDEPVADGHLAHTPQDGPFVHPFGRLMPAVPRSRLRTPRSTAIMAPIQHPRTGQPRVRSWLPSSALTRYALCPPLGPAARSHGFVQVSIPAHVALVPLRVGVQHPRWYEHDGGVQYGRSSTLRSPVGLDEAVRIGSPRGSGPPGVKRLR
jgi:hypothetical protein